MKSIPIQAFKNDAYNACVFVCKAAVAATAIAAAGVALHHFLQPPPEPTCADILKNLETELYIGYHERSCFEQQQHAVGMGTPEECMAALSDYHPTQTSTLDVVAAIGGAEPFCNLPSIKLEKELVPNAPIPDSVVATILKHGSVRGMDSSYQLFVGVKTSVTETRTHPLISEEEIEKRFNRYDKPEAKIFFHAFADTRNAWQAASCELEQSRCSFKNLEHSAIENLGRLVREKTVCDTDIAAGSSIKTCRTLL